MDRTLLNLAQKIQNFFQIVFDLNCFSISRFFYLTIIGLSALFGILSMENGNEEYLLMSVIMATIMSAAFFLFYCLTFRLEKNVCKNAETANVCEIEFRGLRLCSLLIIIMMGLAVAHIISIAVGGCEVFLLNIIFIFFSIALYFASCTPLPPAESKIKQWIGSLALKPKCDGV